MHAPPVLTAERIDAMLSIMAEVCLEAVVDAGQRQKAADDVEAFERGGRTLQRACRNLRQTIAMKQRHDREEARKADDGRRLAEADRKQAERSHEAAVAHKQARVQRHFERVLWDEYEDDDAQERFDDLDARLDELAEEPGFLDIPAETLIQRLAEEIGLGDAETEPPPREPSPPTQPRAARASSLGDPTLHGVVGERVGRGGVDAGSPVTHPHPRPLPARGRGAPETSASSAISAVESDGPAAEAPPPSPPDPPPDPAPEPYIPPWERLRPGQRMPGGTGW